MNRNQLKGLLPRLQTNLRRHSRNALVLLVILGTLVNAPCWAGAFIFAGESNGVDIIAHPTGYTGAGTTLNVRVCIDAGSLNASNLEIPVQNNITIWNNLQPVLGNISSPLNFDEIDAESVLLHEMGHCIGLAHPNLATESGLSGSNQNFTKSTDGANNVFDIDAGVDGVIGSSDDVRGDDVNMHWFNASNDPFLLPIPTPVDTTTYSRNVADLPPGDNWVANADRTLSTFLGYAQSEASMQQGSYYGEAQRELVSDDVATILLARSGFDELAGTGDDYDYVLTYEGIVTDAVNAPNCDITISIDDTSFAYCQTGGSYINYPSNHLRITSANIHLGTSYNWYFNDQLIGNVNQPPVASFNYDCTDLDCTFTDTSTDDDTIVSWSWNFGDTSTSTAQNPPPHTYAAAGTYNVTLTVTDNEGETDDVTIPVTAAQVGRGPYLQTMTDTSVIVRWRTDLATDSVVRYGIAPGSLTLTETVAGSVTEHTVQLTGLSPLTQYYYSVGNSTSTFAGNASFNFTTSPTPGTSVPTRFWVIGDSGTADNNAAAVRDRYKEYAVATDPADFWLMLGDNAYNSGYDTEFQAAVFEMYPEILRQLPLWPTLGNHDGYQADSATQTGPYYDIFDLPTGGEAGGLASGTEAYYAFDYGDIHFIVLDSYETDRAVDGAMLTWLESDLASNDKPWVVAFWHHPPYTKGSHDSDTEGELLDMRQNALPILEAWGVDLVLTGHSHSYERSVFLDSHYGTSGTLDVGTMVLNAGNGSETGDGAYTKPGVIAAEHEGAVYAVAGSSGKLSTVDAEWPHPVMVSYLEELGSMVIDVDGDRLDAIFINSTGVIRDEFTIIKTADLSPPLINSASAEDATHVWVEFNEKLDAATAETAGNYSINDLSISNAQLLTGGKTVRLTVSSMTPNGYYLVTVNNIEDLSNNVIAPNSQADFYYTTPVVIGLQTGTFDASFRENNANTNYGAEQFLEVDGDATADEKHALVGWDLGSIPTTAVIDAARIHLMVFDVTTGSFSCNTMISPWTELEVTWNEASSGVPWQTPGATGAADRGSDIICGSFGASTAGPITVNLNSLGVAQVQRWVDGTDPNYGLMLGNPTSTNGADFRSSEYTVAAERPELEVTYHMPVVVPDAPTDLTATAVSYSQINLAWTDNSANETGFRVERSADGSTGWSGIASLGPSVTAYSNTGLSELSTWYYRVYALNDSGNSGFSNVASDTTPAEPNLDPVASFTHSCANLSCTFTDTSTDSDGIVVAWSWDFGDSSTSTLQNPAHQYLTAGSYTVTLTVTDNDGATDNTGILLSAANPKLYVGVVDNVSSTGWTTVSLPRSYTSMVVIGSANYSENDDQAVVRINNVTTSSFDVRVQNPVGATISGIPVHFVAIEEGVYTAAANGATMEAVKYTSTVTDYNGVWNGESRSYANSYTNPVVLGQVMSYNDTDWSVFWAGGNIPTNPPTSSSLLVGKHVSLDSNNTRADETVGYIVIEQGSGSISNVEYATAVGTNSVRGMGNAPPYPYSISGPTDADTAVVSSAAIQNLSGTWPVLFGATPVSETQLQLAVDESEGNRKTTVEQVAYMVFKAPDVECTASRSASADTWLFFSLPCTPADTAASRVFAQGPTEADYGSTWIIYHYDSSTDSYAWLGADDPLVEGKGYLLYSYDAFNPLTISGNNNTGTPIGLVAESDVGVWNLVGNPHNASVLWTNVSVDDGASSYDFASMDPSAGGYDCEQTPAAAGCIMWHVMYMWNGSAYQTRDGAGGDPGTLPAFDAMWVRSHRANTITLPAPPAAALADQLENTLQSSVLGQAGLESVATTSKTNSKGGNSKPAEEWYVRLVVESRSHRDDGNWLGQAATANDGLDSRDLEEWTPFTSPYLTVLFTNPAFDEVEWGYTTDYRAPTRKPDGEWPFVVRSSGDFDEVTLSWEGAQDLLRKAWLIDGISGEVINAGAVDSYTFTMVGTEHPFRFTFANKAPSGQDLK